MEDDGVLWTGHSRWDWDVLSMFVARVELVKLSDVPEKVHNAGPLSLQAFWLVRASASSLHRSIY